MIGQLFIVRSSVNLESDMLSTPGLYFVPLVSESLSQIQPIPMV